MKKLFIGLLVVAAGAGTLFYFNRKTPNKPSKDSLVKEWIIGKWKADTAADSVFSKYSYNFLKDGSIVRSLNDSAKADTAHYEWNKTNELVWKENASDSTGKSYAVIKLTQDSLQVKATDNSTMLFTKMK